jgi:hypothetical protein
MSFVYDMEDENFPKNMLKYGSCCIAKESSRPSLCKVSRLLVVNGVGGGGGGREGGQKQSE